MNQVSREKLVSGFIWRGFERTGDQIISMIVQVILARLLIPADFGLVAIIITFILIGNVIINCGYSTGLVQKKNASELDFCSVMWFSLGFATLCYITLWFAAPWISQFYNDVRLTLLLRVTALTLFLDAMSLVPDVIVAKKFLFQKLIKAVIFSSVLSGIVGISMAYHGCGIWSLVGQVLTYNLTRTTGLWWSVAWQPQWIFSWLSLKEMFGFSSKIFVVSVLDTIMNNIYYLIIGTYYNSATLGYYTRARSFPFFISKVINNTVAAVLFPALAQLQDTPEQFLRVIRKYMQGMSFLLFPVMFGLISVSRPLTMILFTKKWLPSVLMMQLLCAYFAFFTITLVYNQAFTALGKASTYLKFEFLKKSSFLLIIITTYSLGVNIMLISQIIFAIGCLIVSGIIANYSFKYSLHMQLQDMFPPFILSFVMFLILFVIERMITSNYQLISLQLGVGVVFYVFFSAIFRLRGYLLFHDMIKSIIQNKLKKRKS